MNQPQSTEIPLKVSRNAWQYGLRDILLVTLGLSVLLATGQAFGGAWGPIELGLVILAGTSVVLAAISARARWPWPVGLVVCFLAAWFFAPPGRILRYAFVPGALVSGVYAAAGLPVVLVSRRGETRWPWMLGAVACFLCPALVTPPDPFSTLIAAAPVCLCYALVALAWRRRKSALLVMGPVFLLGSAAIVLGSHFAASEPEATLHLLTSVYPVVLLGAAVTILAVLNR